MKEILEQMKNITICEPIVSIKTKLDDVTKESLKELVKNILN